jgi:hypothetical protein
MMTPDRECCRGVMSPPRFSNRPEETSARLCGRAPGGCLDAQNLAFPTTVATHSKGLRAKMGILRIQGSKRPKESQSLSAQERLIEVINTGGLAAGKA